MKAKHYKLKVKELLQKIPQVKLFSFLGGAYLLSYLVNKVGILCLRIKQITLELIALNVNYTLSFVYKETNDSISIIKYRP